ncbi:MAG: rod shape-determining protein MreC [Candidatus Puniceispirillales bacterium WSBS_2018_MAG_OTU23]
MVRVLIDRSHGRKSNGYVIHGIIFFICIILITLGKADISAMNSLRTVMTGLVVPIADVVSVPVKAAAGMIEGIENVANLNEENRRLKDQVKRLSRWRLKAEILQTENRQLRSINSVIIPRQVKAVSARVIAINADSFAHSVMINAGHDQAIKKGHAVTTADGLVGIIIDVGARHAQVLLLTDINSLIPVILSSSSWPAVAVGQNATALKLRFLPIEASISIDELVQTSGHGGVLPPGLPVGRVSAVHDNTITIDPVVDLQRLSFVTVLVTETDPGFSVDDISAQTYSPLPPIENNFTLKGLNALGQRTDSDAEGGNIDADAPISNGN